MRVLAIQAFRSTLLNRFDNVRSCLAGLDVGRKHIGLAICPMTIVDVKAYGSIEVPYKYALSNIDSSKARPIQVDYEKLAKKLQSIVDKEQIVGLVVGFPLSKEGEITPLCEEILNLIQVLPLSMPNKPHEEMLVTFWDERNTSVGARQIAKAISQRRSVAKKYKDSFAASLILQGFLDGR
jgi:putative transcription antitermination factor YqgF